MANRNGLNILDALFEENAQLKNEMATLREDVQALKERLDTLTFNIPEATVNNLIARALDMHAQVLFAATRPAPPQAEEQNVPITT